MDGSYLLQMNLRSGHGSTSAGAGHGLGEGQGESGQGNGSGNGESHEAPSWVSVINDNTRLL